MKSGTTQGRISRWAIAASLLALLLLGGVFLAETPKYHGYVVFQTSESLKIVFLQRGKPTKRQCEAVVDPIVKTMLAQCGNCRLLERRCLDELDPRHRKILSGLPVDVPVMRVPGGAVAFLSNAPEVALEICKEAERHTSQSVPAECVAAGVASTAISLAWLDRITEATALPTFNPTLRLILFAAVMSLVALYLALRTRRLNGRINRDVTVSTPSLSSSVNEFQFVQKTKARTIVKLDYVSKHGFDIVFAVVGIMIFLPFFMLVPVAIKLIDWRCPVLVSIRSMGKGGRLFRMYKFSTMVSDADKVLADLLARDPAMRKEWEQHHKLINDPRLLPVIGKFLRKFSINELPQLFNVLKGEMAMVGPRPISREEEAKYEEFGGHDLLRQRHSIRPGITGLWQISGRNNISYRERVLIDAHYLQNRSLPLDFKILLKTVVVVVRGDGAY